MRCDAHQAFCRHCSEEASSSRISSGRSGAESTRRRLDDVFGSLNHTLSGASAGAADAGLPRGAGAGASRAIVATTSKEAAKKSKRAAPAAAQSGVHDRNLGPAVVRRRGARGRDVFPARAEGAERRRREACRRRRRRRRGAEVSEATPARRGSRAPPKRPPCRSRTSMIWMMGCECTHFVVFVALRAGQLNSCCPEGTAGRLPLERRRATLTAARQALHTFCVTRTRSPRFR